MECDDDTLREDVLVAVGDRAADSVLLSSFVVNAEGVGGDVAPDDADAARDTLDELLALLDEESERDRVGYIELLVLALSLALEESDTLVDIEGESDVEAVAEGDTSTEADWFRDGTTALLRGDKEAAGARLKVGVPRLDGDSDASAVFNEDTVSVAPSIVADRAADADTLAIVGLNWPLPLASELGDDDHSALPVNDAVDVDTGDIRALDDESGDWEGTPIRDGDQDSVCEGDRDDCAREWDAAADLDMVDSSDKLGLRVDAVVVVELKVFAGTSTDAVALGDPEDVDDTVGDDDDEVDAVEE